MAGIDIKHKHSLPLATARSAVEDVARKLAERFDFEYGWDGDDMHFKRPGVDGRIAVGKEDLHVTARLGMLLSALQGTVEKEIRKVLDEKFS
jgi:putative polyhydroxyalkanoate system protein